MARITPVHSQIAAAAILAAAAWQGLSAQTLITSNMNAASASVVDVATGRTIATLATGEGPHEVAVSHDGKWAVVSVYGGRGGAGHSLLVIDVGRGAEARRIELGEYTRPHGMAFLPGDQKMLITSEATQRVLVVDFAAGKVDTTIATNAAGTHMVALVPDGSKAYTTNVGAGSVSVIDVPGRRLEKTITVAPQVEGLAVSPNGKEVWAAGRAAKTVYVVDPATGKIANELTGFGLPYRIAITRDGKTAVVTDPGDEKIHIFDAQTKKTRFVVDAPQGSSPQGVTIGPDGRGAFVTLKAAGRVALIDLESGKILKELTVGGGSDGVGVAK